MPGSHGLVVLADFLTKGIVGPSAADVHRAAAAQLAAQDAADGYAALGFVPVPDDGAPGDGASLTLEYAFDDFAGSVIADAAGAADDAARWRARAGNYRNVFNAGAGGMCPRFRNGTWPACPPLDLPPILLNKWYTEGDGLQWTFAVPHDVPGLVALFPSPAAYVGALLGVMTNTSRWAGPLLAALPNPWLWIGNEPSLLLPWMFNWVPESAHLTQFWVRWTLDTYFPLTPDGVPGNSDFGATEGYSVWACLGLYPLPATGLYALTSPCFANTTLQLPAAEAAAAGYAHAPRAPRAGAPPVPLLTIVAHNFSVANVYIASATLNGAPLPTPFASHAALFPPLCAPRPGEDARAHAARVAAGGASVLEFVLTSEPGAWGA
jgi:putative alpha-1,2-mannosidase